MQPVLWIIIGGKNTPFVENKKKLRLYGPNADVTSLTLVYKWYYLQSLQLSNAGRGQHLEFQSLENTNCRWHRTSLSRSLISVKLLSRNRRDRIWYSNVAKNIPTEVFPFFSQSLHANTAHNTLTLQQLTGTLCTTRFNNHKLYVLPTQRIYVFCMDIRANSDYFPIQH